VFHVTAITRRRDVLYQTIKHGVGKKLGWCDGAPMGALGTEARAWQVLKQAGIDVVDVYSPPGPGVNCHLRVSIKKRSNADPHAAIVALLGMLRTTKHVYVTDDDVDIRSSEEMEWAMSGRFQGSKDIYVMKDMPFMPMDPSADKAISDKVGFDCTWNYPRPTAVTARVPEAAKIEGPARFQTVQQALETGPMHFAKLMSVLGSRDGRELVRQIETLRDAGHLDRNSDGEYYLKK
jgi:2,5-furandicarboxylate decarboxylase 1